MEEDKGVPARATARSTSSIEGSPDNKLATQMFFKRTKRATKNYTSSIK
jgi:hypothetical protein